MNIQRIYDQNNELQGIIIPVSEFPEIIKSLKKNSWFYKYLKNLMEQTSEVTQGPRVH